MGAYFACVGNRFASIATMCAASSGSGIWRFRSTWRSAWLWPEPHSAQPILRAGGVVDGLVKAGAGALGVCAGISSSSPWRPPGAQAEAFLRAVSVSPVLVPHG